MNSLQKINEAGAVLLALEYTNKYTNKQNQRGSSEKRSFKPFDIMKFSTY